MYTERAKGATTMYDDYSYESAMAAMSFECDSEPEEWPDDLWDEGPDED